MPAFRNPIEVTQPDGSKLTILLKGDEFFHYAQSTDGYVLKENREGYYTYATTNAAGLLESSEVVARNVGNRASDELRFLKTIRPGLTAPETLLNHALLNRMSRSTRGNPKLRGSQVFPPGLLANYPAVGSPKSLVILVNFSDTVFRPNHTNSDFDRMLNQVGYSDNGHNGSVRDFYKYNSGGAFTPDYVVVGPVKVSQPMAYYGENDSVGNDRRPAQLIYDACVKAAGLVNFADFDFNNDGYVDNVYVFYAGKGEADGGGENTIWPHSWSLSSAQLNLTLNGKKVDTYACSGEMSSSLGENITGIGTFTHEYGHILGLTDMYDVDYDQYNGDGFDLNYWSLMAYGAYNNYGRTPPCLSLPERYFLGWANPEVLDSTQLVTMNDFGSSNKGYLIRTIDSGEYYLLENRQRNKNVWDQYLPYHGMLVYHIDQRTEQNITLSYWGKPYTFSMYEMWGYNMVNAVANHQCCDILEADNIRILYDGTNAADYIASIQGDPFPGTRGITSLTDFTAPSLLTWKAGRMNKPITAIRETNGVIQFRFNDFTEFAKAPVVNNPSAVGPYFFTLRWNSTMNATGYLIDIYALDSTKNPVETNYVGNFHNCLVTDTTLQAFVPKDLTNYRYTVRATYDNTLFSPASAVRSVTTTNGMPSIQSPTSVGDYSFQANWQKPIWATGFYLDVFRVDETTGDTLWVDNYHNYYLTKNYEVVHGLYEDTNYQYRVRSALNTVVSRNSDLMAFTTKNATKLSAYTVDKTIHLIGVDRNTRSTVYDLFGNVVSVSDENLLSVNKSGIYVVAAHLNGQVKHLKLLIN